MLDPTIRLAKIGNKQLVNVVLSIFSEASTLAQSQVSETYKHARMFIQPPVSEVSGAGDH